jgi:nucleoside-diphosphate-sugar epimerase
MKILLTGASGFIGEIVLSKLLERNHEVTAAYSRTPVTAKTNSQFNSIQLDLLNSESLTEYFMGYDCVIHLAYNFAGTVEEQFTFATHTTESLLRACAEAKVKKIVYSSTISVYGEPPYSGLITEKSPRISSLQPYALSKQAAEKIFLASEIEDTEIVILQPSIVYGPGQGYWTAGIMKRMQESLMPLINQGNGYCNPVYVDDVAQAVVQASETTGIHKECFIINNNEPVKWAEFLGFYEDILRKKTLINLPHYIYNHPPSIRRHRRVLRKVIRKLSGFSHGKPIQYPSPDEIRFFSAQPIFSNQKAHDTLKFQPQISLETGMEKIQEWWQNLKTT